MVPYSTNDYMAGGLAAAGAYVILRNFGLRGPGAGALAALIGYVALQASYASS